jgi:hypothetical protein
VEVQENFKDAMNSNGIFRGERIAALFSTVFLLAAATPERRRIAPKLQWTGQANRLEPFNPFTHGRIGL